MSGHDHGRVSTGVQGLDQMLGGGFIRGNANLVAGSPGTGKTTLGLHFMAAAVAAGESCVFVTFEYLPQQIYRDAEARGWPLQRWEREGKVHLVCTTPDVLLAETENGGTVLDEAIAEVRASRLVIDSMSHFEFIGRAPHELREDVAGLMNHLRLLEVSTLVTLEIPDIIGQAVRISDFGLEFLVDTVVLLRYVELEGELQKAVSVLKFRGGDHDRHFRRLRLTPQGMVIEKGFEGVENIAGGAARRTVVERAKELI